MCVRELTRLLLLLVLTLFFLFLFDLRVILAVEYVRTRVEFGQLRSGFDGQGLIRRVRNKHFLDAFSVHVRDGKLLVQDLA